MGISLERPKNWVEFSLDLLDTNRPPKNCRRRFSLAIMLCLFGLQFTVPATPPPAMVEEQARTVMDKFTAAMKAKDADGVSRLLSKDCIVIMLDSVAVSGRARFFTQDSYLELLKQRYSETTATNSNRVIRDISTSKTGDVFVTIDAETRARTETRSEWFRSHEYIVMRPVSGNLLIVMVVAQMVFYVPDVPPEPTAEPKSNRSQ